MAGPMFEVSSDLMCHPEQSVLGELSGITRRTDDEILRLWVQNDTQKGGVYLTTSL
jgi:hypothetical protein